MSDEVTLDYVAKTAGVSRATASRALNGRPGVAKEVRDRVRMVANSLNYRPNRAAQNLAGGRSRVVGLVLGGLQLQTDVYATALVQSVASAADHYDEGLMLLLASTEPGRAVQNLLRDGLVDGVVVSAVAAAERWVQELLATDLAKVLIGSHPQWNNIPSVDVENRESSAAIVGHLIDNGCERIGVVTGPLGRVDARLRLEGFRLAHNRRGLTIDDSLIKEGEFSRESGFAHANTLLTAGVDAIFGCNDEMALGAVRAAIERDLRLPHDLQVAGFDGTSISDVTGPRLTTVVQPFDALAMTAMGTLLEVISKNEVPHEQLVEPKISFGNTTNN